jgi:hypothetical protein
MDYLLTYKSRFLSAPPNGHEKSPQNGQVKEEKSSPTRIGLVTDSRGEQT